MMFLFYDWVWIFSRIIVKKGNLVNVFFMWGLLILEDVRKKKLNDICEIRIN